MRPEANARFAIGSLATSSDEPPAARVLVDVEPLADRREHDDAVRGEGVRELRRAPEPALVEVGDRADLPLGAGDLVVDEPLVERRHDRRVDDRERCGDEHEQREPEPDGDAEAHQASRKRYPTPRTVKMYSGRRGSVSSFSRRWRTCTSIVRGSR